MNNARDELARDIFIADNWRNTQASGRDWDWMSDEQVAYAYAIADGLIAKGYRKPVDD